MKLIPLVAALTLGVSLAACERETTASTTTLAPTAASKDTTVALPSTSQPAAMASSSINQPADSASTNVASASDRSMSGGWAAGDDSVRQLQQALKDKGFDPGPVDGIMGSRTQAAIGSAKQANADIPGLNSVASASSSPSLASASQTKQ